MKLGKIGALCKNAKRVVIHNFDGVQWISDGCAFYPLRDLPELLEDNIYTIFDIPEEKRGKISFEEREHPPFGITLYERFYPDEERAYVAVKRGMLLEGIILPAEIATTQLAEMFTIIGKLTGEIASDKPSEEYEQESLDV